MCFDLDSSPPIPVIRGAAVTHEDLTLQAADGNRFAAFAATPEESSSVGVVILPDVRGLYRFYEELALRFAERGMSAVAFDYFGRTAGTAKRGEDFEYMPHVDQTAAALEAAGVEHELVTYEGAPHSFFDRKQEEFADASEDAWSKVLAFLESHS